MNNKKKDIKEIEREISQYTSRKKSVLTLTRPKMTFLTQNIDGLMEATLYLFSLNKEQVKTISCEKISSPTDIIISL